MVDGVINDNAIIVIQARLGSTRLPNKVLKKINNKPLLKILIQRLQLANCPIIVATTESSKDDKLVEYLKQENITYYRGSEQNVFNRFLQIYKIYNPKIIVRITADNPLIDGELLKEKIRYCENLQTKKYYFSLGKSNTYPIGLTFEIISGNLFSRILSNNYKLSQKEMEHVTPIFYNGKMKDVDILTHSLEKDYSWASFTVDTIDDFNHMKHLIEKEGFDNLSIQDIISKYCKLGINLERKQKNWHE